MRSPKIKKMDYTFIRYISGNDTPPIKNGHYGQTRGDVTPAAFVGVGSFYKVTFVWDKPNACYIAENVEYKRIQQQLFA